jgi:hypothetical protein
MRRWLPILSLLIVSCIGKPFDPGDESIGPGDESMDPGDKSIWADDPDPNARFLTAPPPYPACAQDIAFKPADGYHGGILGQKRCGPASPDCPTTYIEGNTGAPCSSASDCTGKDPVCLTGPKYPGGSCAATGCEFGSNRGCPKGDFCMSPGDGQTYCVDGCGIDETGCFKHCARDGYACFTSESDSLGMCLGTDGSRECNPTASATCTNPSFGDGVCGQTAWDDQSIGRCFETCDPLEQDCSKDGTACYALIEYQGYPVCFQHQGEQDGSSCGRTTECGEGLRCSCDDGSVPCTAEKHCRAYCTTDGDYPCANPSYRCRPLVEGGRLGSCHPA